MRKVILSLYWRSQVILVHLVSLQGSILHCIQGKQLRFIGTEHAFEENQTSSARADGAGAPGGPIGKALWDVRATLLMLGEGAWFDFGFYVHDFRFGGIAARTQRFGFYWNLDPALKFGAARLGPKPMVPAYAAMTWLLDGSTSMGVLPGLSGSQRGYRFRRDGRITAAVWDPAGASALVVPTGTVVCDWFANCAATTRKTVALGPQPVYLKLP